ncbi:hypothetical protein [Leptodesmis sichuanensis]|uniref:hypothetical protein n=1 Tax=Leptodesmis sichuanensis TaxID=2906798 RepID=UPI001F38F62C|nr:hypothetical protein [Leptodesmis sichuanensis]UIE40273.1 hypothetical protein KIK02_12470 [Leptodesmis sichuanensis A121]
MTPEERFAQIESILLQNTSQIATLLEGQIKLQQGMEELRQAQIKTDAQIARTQEQLDDLARDTRASIEDLVEMATTAIVQSAENSTFIKGLQLENRRILRELRDRRNNRDS